MATDRLFVALELPRALRESIAGLLAPLRAVSSPVKWERTDKLHVTLRFIGDTPGERVPLLVSGLRRASEEITEAFTVRFSSTGFFPPNRHPKVLWIGLTEGNNPLIRLHTVIERELLSLGMEQADRRFHPHITVGRIRNQVPSSRLLEEFEKLTLHSDPVKVEEFVLMKSELRPDTSVYSVLERFPIGKASPKT